MNKEDREFVLALARAHIELHNELLALRMLLQEQLGFTEEEYQRHLESVLQARTDLRAGVSAEESLLKLLRDFEGPLQ
jgi:hypothetical protein